MRLFKKPCKQVTSSINIIHLTLNNMCIDVYITHYRLTHQCLVVNYLIYYYKLNNLGFHILYCIQ